MGGVVSSGQSNDDLIDNLLDADYIKSSRIERVFRAVDRAEYFLPEARHYAYNDSAWKQGHLHISAPCIYSEVMEGLNLERGQSFLNIGSGTGYLSTIVGLILGTTGINHGLEIHADVVNYAQGKLQDFAKHSGAIDEFDFCPPVFRQGNGLSMSNVGMLYDRVYCGAACPEKYELYLKSLVKIGGILVMPLNDQLLQIKRLHAATWETHTLLPVSFASLIHPPEDVHEALAPFEIEVSSLQSLCRSSIRNILRQLIDADHPPAKKLPLIGSARAVKKKLPLRRCVVAIFESDDTSDDERPQNQAAEERNDDFYQMMYDIFSTRPGQDNRIIPLRRNRRERRPSRNVNLNANALDSDSNEEDKDTDGPNTEAQVEVEVYSPNTSTVQEPNPVEEEPSTSTVNSNQSKPTDQAKSDRKPIKSAKREKFDSGLGDEIVQEQSSSESSSSSDDDEDIQQSPRDKKRTRSSVVTRRWVPQISFSSSDNEPENEEIDVEKPPTDLYMYKSPYTEEMRQKIQRLPLPHILIRYMNYYRDN